MNLSTTLGTEWVEPTTLPELQAFAECMEASFGIRNAPLNKFEREAGAGKSNYPRKAGCGSITLHHNCNLAWRPGIHPKTDCLNNDFGFSAHCEAFLLQSRIRKPIQGVETFWSSRYPLVASEANAIHWEAARKIINLPEAEWCVHFRVSDDESNTSIVRENFDQALRLMGRVHSLTQESEKYAYRFKGVRTNYDDLRRQVRTVGGIHCRSFSHSERVDANLILLIVPFHAPKYGIVWEAAEFHNPTMIGIIVRDDAAIDAIIADASTTASTTTTGS